MRKLLALAVVAFGLGGCGILDGLGGGKDEPAGLRRFSSDQDLLNYFGAQTGAAVNARGDQLAGEADGDVGSGANAPPGAVPSPSDDDGAAGPTGHSTTTEQEAGVQEADIIKNDGQHIYLLSRGVLRVVQATPAESMAEVGALDLDGSGQELYLVGDQAVAIITPNATSSENDLVADAWLTWWRPRTQVSIIDLADKTAPQLRSRIRFDGYVSSSRVIGDRLYLVVVNYPNYWMPLWDAVALRTTAGEEVTADELLPDVVIEKDGGEVYNGNISQATEVLRPNEPDGLGFTSLITIPLESPENYAAETVVGYPANTYASTQAIYLTNSAWDFTGQQRETTDIYKFALTEEGTSLGAAGEVPGRVLNQYSMSEHNGYLRVATTIGPTWDITGQTSESTNHVFVLEQVGERLDVAGRLDNLAPGETIYSARFLGDRGFLVTFEQIDPLFTLDLSNPREPKVVGELKVPGFSTFILPLGERHLLTIGQHTADAPWGGTRAEGVRLSIFDVGDFANPQLVTAEVVGTNGGYSEAVYNPKAFTYFAEAGLLAFPMEYFNWTGGEGGGVIEGDGDGSAGREFDARTSDDGSGGGAVPPADGDVTDVLIPSLPPDYFRGLYVYHVSIEDGISLIGRISSAPEGVDESAYWPEFTRGAFIGDAVYSITSDCMKAARTSSVEAVVKEITFARPADDGNDVGGDDGTGGSDPGVIDPGLPEPDGTVAPAKPEPGVITDPGDAPDGITNPGRPTPVRM